jgi:hypothetical protein
VGKTRPGIALQEACTVLRNIGALTVKVNTGSGPCVFDRIGFAAGYFAFAAPHSVEIGAANICCPNGTTVS